MIIEKIGSDKKLEKIIEEGQERYEERNGVACNYTPFCFCAKENDEIIGAVTGFTCFSEVYTDDLIVVGKH